MTLTQEKDREVALWEAYKRLEQVQTNLWIIAMAAFRNYVRTQDESEWEAYERTVDLMNETRADVESTRREWKLVCMRLHNFPMSDKDAQADQPA